MPPFAMVMKAADFIFAVTRRCDPRESEAAPRPFLREHAGGQACCGFLRSGEVAAQLNIGPRVVALLPRAISPYKVVMEPAASRPNKPVFFVVSIDEENYVGSLSFVTWVC
jgi:hypothetical protein